MKILKKLFDRDFNELLGHAKNYLTADIFGKGLVFLSIPIFTNILSISEYGVLGVYNSVTYLIVVIFGLGFRGAITRYFYEKKHDFNQFITSNILFINLWMLFAIFVVYPNINFLETYFNLPKNVFIFCISVSFFTVIFEFYQSYLQASMKSYSHSLLSVIKSFFNLSFSLVFIFFLIDQNKYFGPIYAEIIVIFMLYIYCSIKLYKLTKFDFKLSHIRYSLIFGIPVVFHLLSQSILATFDQIIINQLLGAEKAGLYTFAYQVGLIQSVIILGILKAWNPIFYKKMNKNNFNQISSLAKKYSKIVFLIAIFLMLFSNEIGFLLSPADYHSSLSIIPVIIISYVFYFLYTMYVGYFFYRKKTYVIAIISVICGLINILLNYYLIPIYGFESAAWTTLISFFCLFYFHFIIANFLFEKRTLIELKIFAKDFFIVILIFIATILIRFDLMLIFQQLFLKFLILVLSILIILKSNYTYER